MDCNAEGSRRDACPLQGDLGLCETLGVIVFLLSRIKFVWLEVWGYGEFFLRWVWRCGLEGQVCSGECGWALGV